MTKRSAIPFVALMAVVVLGLTNCSNANQSPVLVVNNQKLGYGKVFVTQVVSPEAGFVVVHQPDDKGQPNVMSSLGYVAVRKGAASMVAIKLDPSVKPGTKLFVVLHADTGKIGKYEHGPATVEIDAPVIVDGKQIAAAFTVE